MKTQKDKVNRVAGKAIKTLIEFCLNEKMLYPKITMEAEITDGEKYRLVFERIDLDQDERDTLLDECMEYAKTQEKISASMLQSKFRVGYCRAGRIIDQLENNGTIEHFSGSKERKVLASAVAQ